MGYIHKLLGLVSIFKIGNDPPVLMSWKILFRNLDLPFLFKNSHLATWAGST